MKRHPNVVWLVLCKTRRARNWYATFHSSYLPQARRSLKEQVAKFPKLDHRLFRVVIPAVSAL